MTRPYIEHGIEQLEEIVGANREKRPVLAEILEELQYRRSLRAKQLRKEVQALLDGVVGQVRPPRPDDQAELSIE